jgi:hypothetical protein
VVLEIDASARNGSNKTGTSVDLGAGEAVSSKADTAVAGNTSRAKLQAVQPKFGHRIYRALGL